jgi:hypothetical protein
MPAPAAAFSAFAMTKSTPHSVRKRGSRSASISRPGRPTISPIKSNFNIVAELNAEPPTLNIEL